MARDLIEIMTEEPDDSIELDIHLALPDEVRTHLARSEELRDQAARAQGEAARELRAAARALHGLGMSMREIGSVLGVSYQRAHQLVSRRDVA